MTRKHSFMFMFLFLFAVVSMIGCVPTASSTTATTQATSNSTTTTNTTMNTTVTNTQSTTPLSYTVTFVSNGGTDVTSLVVLPGSLLTEATSTLEDYTLLGWFTSDTYETEWNFSADTVNQNLTLYAKWQFSYALQGSGTEVDPYLVSSTKDLDVIRTGLYETTSSQYFEQTIDLTIVSSFEDIDGVIFYGHFKGNGHTITVTGDSGVFFENGGTIENLVVLGDIESDSVSSLGMLANFNSGTISQVSAQGNGVRSLVGVVGVMDPTTGGAGAIVGTNRLTGVLVNCESDTNVQARVGGGGIVGNNFGTVTLCSSWGTVGESEVIYISEAEKTVGKFSYMGGIAGINSGLIEQSQNRGRVFAQRAGNSIDDATNNNKVFGGIAGYNYASGIVTECYNAYGTAGATVHADRIVGGIVGQNFGTVSYSYSPANIGGRANIGGIVGLSDESETSVANVSYCYSNSNFKSDGNEIDELSPFNVADVSNWYSVSKYADNCYYHGTRGQAPTGEGNLSGVSVTLDMTALLNSGLASGEEKYIATNGSSSGNAKTKLVWQKSTMTFDVNGTESSVQVPMGNTPEFSGTPEQTGYTFVEWRTDLLDSQTKWTPGGITTNQKVYAYFEITTFDITYVLDNGVNNASNPETYTYETPTITLLDPTREGCTFLGWFDESDQQVLAIEQGSTGNLTLSAKWQISVEYITLHFNDETLIDTTLLNLVSASYTLPMMTLSGYDFLGWSLDGLTVAYQGDDVVTYALLSGFSVEGVVTFTPLFEQIFNYTVSFDANGGTGTMDPLTLQVGKSATLSSNQFTADGYTFVGWMFDGKLIDDEATITDLVTSGENALLVAQWIATTLVTNGDFATGGEFVSSDSKLYTSENWNVYRSGTTKVSSLAAIISGGEMTVTATTTTGAIPTNFYAYTIVSLPGIQVGDYYYATFDAKVSDAQYNIIGVYLRAKAAGSTSFTNVSDLVTFTTMGTDYSTFSTPLLVTGNVAEGSTYYLIITLGMPTASIAGDFVFTFDNVGLYNLGSVVTQ